MKRLCFLMLTFSFFGALNFAQINAECPPIDRVHVRIESTLEPWAAAVIGWILVLPPELKLSCGASCTLSDDQKQPIIDWVRASAREGFLSRLLASFDYKVTSLTARNHPLGDKGTQDCSFTFGL